MPRRYSHTSPGNIQLSLWLSEGLHESLEAFCRRVGKNRSEVIREAVTLYLTHQALSDCRGVKG